MQVDVALTPPSSAPADRTCLVVDVLRATSVIAVLLERGVGRIYPTGSVEAARTLRAELTAGGEPVFLLGEVGGLPPAGFDAGNSPTALQVEPIGGTRAVMATSNGTPALLACAGAPLVLAAAVVNASAVTRAAIEAGRDVLVVCAGLGGREGEDDTLAAGLLVDRLVRAGWEAGAVAGEALRRYEAAREDLAGAFRETTHGKRTLALGFDADIEYCATPDQIDAVAVLRYEGARPVLERLGRAEPR
jgi:2-phosphosulfolactate phosphatase